MRRPDRLTTLGRIAALAALASLACPSLAQNAQPGDAGGNPSASYKVGFDYYVGWSNVDTLKQFTDGMWAGSGLAFPSVGYVRWDGPGAEAGKLSLGMGEMYLGGSYGLDQPVEGWWRVPVGKMTATFGKFYVPFAVQEWEYETKPGAMLEWGERGWTVAASLNHEFYTHNANGYLRVGKSLWGDRATLGLSMGVGKGLLYGTSHKRSIAGDLGLKWNGFKLAGERLHAHSDWGDFDFYYGKVAYDRLKLVEPYVAVYSWNDRSTAFGRFRASVYGLNVHLNKNVSVDNAWAATSAGGKWWSQVHVTWEI